ncbi:uncharacterized protein MYCGRDRAFT_105300, partial [Zymoseptoria tritici IPO323]
MIWNKRVAGITSSSIPGRPTAKQCSLHFVLTCRGWGSPSTGSNPGSCRIGNLAVHVYIASRDFFYATFLLLSFFGTPT